VVTVHTRYRSQQYENMKVHLIISFLILLSSCYQNKNSQLNSKNEEIVSTNSTKNVSKRFINQKLNQLDFNPIKESYSESEIANSYFILDTLKKDYNKLTGTTDKWNSQYQMMASASSDGILRNTFQLDDRTKILPFYISGDMENQIFTKWRINPDSSLTYYGKYKPIINSKHSSNKILENLKVGDDEYFIGEMSGGEGGEIWQSIWTAKLIGKNDFIKTDQFGMGYNDSENRKSIKYQLIGETLQIILLTDSIFQHSDSLVRIPIKKEIVKKIKFE